MPYAIAASFLLPVVSARADVDLTLFASDVLVQEPGIVDCTLNTGEASECARLVVKYKPDNLSIGPFCPDTLEDTGGIWNWDGDDAGLYRLDRAFFEMLTGFGLDFSDDSGNVNIADPGAGAPDVDHACLEAGEDVDVEMSVLLPLSPRMADSATDLGTVAEVDLALDGVPIFADAPSVLQTGPLPALDTCGGHVDPGGWYHWHATATDIDTVYKQARVEAECALSQSSAAQFGYAFDGHAMYGTIDPDGEAPGDLDACNGHVSPTSTAPDGEYHYHSTTEFPNLPACLVGVQAEGNFVTTASMEIGSVGGGKGGPGGKSPPGKAEGGPSQ